MPFECPHNGFLRRKYLLPRISIATYIQEVTDLQSSIEHSTKLTNSSSTEQLKATNFQKLGNGFFLLYLWWRYFLVLAGNEHRADTNQLEVPDRNSLGREKSIHDIDTQVEALGHELKLLMNFN